MFGLPHINLKLNFYVGSNRSSCGIPVKRSSYAQAKHLITDIDLIDPTLEVYYPTTSNGMLFL